MRAWWPCRRNWTGYVTASTAFSTQTTRPWATPTFGLRSQAWRWASALLKFVLARKVAAGELQTAWFERHGSTPITEIPSDWPEWYRHLVARRIELIESNPNIGLIERPEYKRRWQRESWDDQVERALRSWLLDRLESPGYWPDPEQPELMSVARLADRAGADREFLQVAALYRGQEAVDVTRLMGELVASESVPSLPVLRYTESGLRTRAEWRETWRLQRDEDEHKPLLDRDGRLIEAIPVPPKYTSKDFQKPEYWGLRGKLDAPKERFIGYPGCERPGDPTPVAAWAGWDHLQQARAIATYFVRLKDEGVPADRLVPLLAGIDELVFWLKLWHNALDPTMGMGLGDYFEDFVKTEAMAAGCTLDQVRAWTPPAPRKEFVGAVGAGPESDSGDHVSPGRGGGMSLRAPGEGSEVLRD